MLRHLLLEYMQKHHEGGEPLLTIYQIIRLICMTLLIIHLGGVAVLVVQNKQTQKVLFAIAQQIKVFDEVLTLSLFPSIATLVIRDAKDTI